MDQSDFPVMWPRIFKAAKYESFYVAIQYFCHLDTLSSNDEMILSILMIQISLTRERGALVLDPISSKLSVCNTLLTISCPCNENGILQCGLLKIGSDFRLSGTLNTQLVKDINSRLCLEFLHRNLLPPGEQLSLSTHNCNTSTPTGG